MADQSTVNRVEATAASIHHVVGNVAPNADQMGWLASYVVAGLVEVADAIRELTKSQSR
jgi:hypothetical protein